MNCTRLISILSLAVLIGACSSGGSNNSNTTVASDAQYRVTFTSIWDDIVFPTRFPANAHFSGLIGTTHNNSVNFWANGIVASDGVKQVAETGGKSAFKVEIESSQNNGNAEFLLDGGGIGSSPGNVSYEFSINQNFSLVTLISMVAPSPDWFVGIHDIDLYDSNAGDWLQSKTIDLKVYDAGTDDGVIFTASNSATSPRENISLLSSIASDTDFVDGVQSGTMQHIGSFVFERIK